MESQRSTHSPFLSSAIVTTHETEPLFSERKSSRISITFVSFLQVIAYCSHLNPLYLTCHDVWREKQTSVVWQHCRRRGGNSRENDASVTRSRLCFWTTFNRFLSLSRDRRPGGLRNEAFVEVWGQWTGVFVRSTSALLFLLSISVSL